MKQSRINWDKIEDFLYVMRPLLGVEHNNPVDVLRESSQYINNEFLKDLCLLDWNDCENLHSTSLSMQKKYPSKITNRILCLLQADYFFGGTLNSDEFIDVILQDLSSPLREDDFLDFLWYHSFIVSQGCSYAQGSSAVFSWHKGKFLEVAGNLKCFQSFEDYYAVFSCLIEEFPEEPFRIWVAALKLKQQYGLDDFAIVRQKVMAKHNRSNLIEKSN